MSGTAADNVGVVGVDVNVDGGTLRRATGTSSWSVDIDTSTYAPGSHALTARVVDGAGNTGTSTIAVTFASSPPVDNTPPSLTISSPNSGATLDGTVSLSGTSSDNVSVSTIQVGIDGGGFQPASGTTNWSYKVDTTLYADGSHVLTVRAADPSGNAVSATENLTIHNSIAAPQAVPAPPMNPGTIGGYAFQESDRDGIYETGEQPLANQHLFLFDAAGTYLANTYSNSTGWFEFDNLADASYRVEYAPTSWWDIRAAWVPDTTTSLQPQLNVTLQGEAQANFGWRPIVRSTQASSPISSYAGVNGLRVDSYDDVVAAKSIYDKLMAGGQLIGSEAAQVTIRFDLATSAATSAMAIQNNGVYTSYGATMNITYLGWLDGDGELFHEYGHAWSLYYAYMVQQDPSLSAYLTARGLAGDSRVGTAYQWDVREMIAEDYRQLFGSTTARAVDQMNRQIPLAKDVPNLATFLMTTFRQPPR